MGSTGCINDKCNYQTHLYSIYYDKNIELIKYTVIYIYRNAVSIYLDLIDVLMTQFFVIAFS